MDRTTNMTVGSPARLILTFSVPLIIANIGQQLYSIVDAIIVGQGVGVEGLAAVGATDWAYWLALWVIGAMTQGFAVPISQYFGEGNHANVKKSVTASIGLCTVIGVIMTIVCLTIANSLLYVLQTPDDIFAGAKVYLTTMYAGIPIVMAYNMSASILRALGDGKTPLTAMVIAGCTNVGLDILFVLVFRWGIVGAAIATLTAQFLAFLYCFIVLRKMEIMKLTRKDWQFDRGIAANECKLGFPLALQHILIVIGGMVLQYAINQYGMVFLAGFTATNKIYGLLESSALAIGFALMTYTAQNYGAGLYNRIRSGLKSSLKIILVLAVCVTVTMILVGKPILMLFIEGSNANAAEVLTIAYRYLVIMSVLLFTLFMLHVFRNTLQGLGDAVTPFWSGVMECLARITMSVGVAGIFGQGAIYFAEPSAWIAAMIVLAVVCIRKVKNLPDV